MIQDFNNVSGYYLSGNSIFECYEDGTEEEIMSNISDEKRAEEILYNLQERLKKKDYELKTITKEHFIKRIIHDFRCPYCHDLKKIEGRHPEEFESYNCHKCGKTTLIDY